MAEILDWNLPHVHTHTRAPHTHVNNHRRHVNTCTCASPAVACCRRELGPGCWKGLSEHLLKGKLRWGRGIVSIRARVFAAGPKLALSSLSHTVIALKARSECCLFWALLSPTFKKVRLYSTVYISLPGRDCLFFCVCQLIFELWVPIKTKHYIRGILPPPASFKLHIEPAECGSNLVIGELLSVSASGIFLFTLSSYLFPYRGRPLMSSYTLIITCDHFHIFNRS